MARKARHIEGCDIVRTLFHFNLENIMKATTQTQFLNVLAKHSATLLLASAQRAEIIAFTKKHSITQEEAKPYIVRHCANLYKARVNVDEQGLPTTFVKPKEGEDKTAWNNARKHAQNLMKAIYAEPKPVVRHKVDEVDALYKKFANLSPRDAKRFLAMVK